MKTCLVVLTDKYPFGDGGAFVENEHYFWNKYDRVLICPVMANNEDIISSDFALYENEVLIESFEKKYNIFGKIFNLFGVVSLCECIMELRNVSCFSMFKTFVFSIYLINSRFKRIYKHVKKYLINDEISNVTIYAYWLYEPAQVGVFLKKYIKKINKNVVLISRAHGYDLYEERQKDYYFPFRDLVLNSTDKILPISEMGKNYLNKKYNYKFNDKIQVSRLGCYKLFENNSQKTDNRIVIVSCSNLVPLKRIEKLIDFFCQYEKEVDWFHFGEGELYNKLVNYSNKLPDNISLSFMGYVSNDILQLFYSNNYIDFFINVSETEGIPVSIMEAFSYGIPVIATDVGGVSEIVYSKKNGVLLNVDFSYDELKIAIDDVIIHGDKYRIEAFETWKRLSDARKVYKEFINLI